MKEQEETMSHQKLAAGEHIHGESLFMTPQYLPSLSFCVP